MLNCPACSKPVNVYAKVCLHCGGSLIPSGDAPAAPELELAPCAKCHHAELVVVSPFCLPDIVQNGTITSLPVASGLEGRWQILTGGSFRAHVCTTCGHTEWYAQELKALAAMAGRIPNVTVVRAKAAPPYR
jgi:hypothetical protein